MTRRVVTASVMNIRSIMTGLSAERSRRSLEEMSTGEGLKDGRVNELSVADGVEKHYVRLGGLKNITKNVGVEMR